MSAIVDTGSQLDVVRADVAALKIGRPVDMSRTTNMSDANGGRGQLQGYIENVDFNCGGVLTSTDLWMSQQAPFELLLGRPWQRGNMVSIDERDEGTYLVFKDRDTRRPRYELLAIPYQLAPEMLLGDLPSPVSNLITFSADKSVPARDEKDSGREIPPSPYLAARTHRVRRTQPHPPPLFRKSRRAAPFSGREPLVRPGSIVGPQTLYTGVETRPNGQEVHHAIFLNSRMLIHNPATAPFTDAAWELEIPFPSAQQVRGSMTGYSAAVHAEVGKQRRPGKHQIDIDRQIRPWASAPLAHTFSAKPVALASIPDPRPASINFSLPLNSSPSTSTPTRPAHSPLQPRDWFVTYPAGTAPEVELPGAVDLGIDQQTGHTVLQLPTSSTAEGKRPDTPFPPRTLQYQKPVVVAKVLETSVDETLKDAVMVDVERRDSKWKPVGNARLERLQYEAKKFLQSNEVDIDGLPRKTVVEGEAVRSEIAVQTVPENAIPDEQHQKSSKNERPASENDEDAEGETDEEYVDAQDESDSEAVYSVPVPTSKPAKRAPITRDYFSSSPSGSSDIYSPAVHFPTRPGSLSPLFPEFNDITTFPDPPFTLTPLAPTVASYSSLDGAVDPSRLNCRSEQPAFLESPFTLNPLAPTFTPNSSPDGAIGPTRLDCRSTQPEFDLLELLNGNSDSRSTQAVLDPAELDLTELLRNDSDLESDSVPALSEISDDSDSAADRPILPLPKTTSFTVIDRARVHQRIDYMTRHFHEPLRTQNQPTLVWVSMLGVSQYRSQVIRDRHALKNQEMVIPLLHMLAIFARSGHLLDLESMRTQGMVDMDLLDEINYPADTIEGQQRILARERTIDAVLDNMTMVFADGTLRIRDDAHLPVSKDGCRVRELSEEAWLQDPTYRAALAALVAMCQDEIFCAADLRTLMLTFTRNSDEETLARGWEYTITDLHQLTHLPPPYLFPQEYAQLRMILYLFEKHNQTEMVDAINAVLAHHFRRPAIINHFLHSGLLTPNDSIRGPNGLTKVQHRSVPLFPSTSPSSEHAPFPERPSFLGRSPSCAQSFLQGMDGALGRLTQNWVQAQAV
ncbi:hypothetical protein DFH06DRAFT_1335926 [Mycena polygramma]|nr:hypothetical protein DFH06DRAFT_1335926 [Mycena polygramma]